MRLIEPLDLVVVSSLASVLKNKLGSFRRVMSALSTWTFFQVCCFLFVWWFYYCCWCFFKQQQKETLREKFRKHNKESRFFEMTFIL